MAHQQVLTDIEVDNMRRERPTKARIFCAKITKFETPINAQQQINNRSLPEFSIEMLQLGITVREHFVSIFNKILQLTSKYCNRTPACLFGKSVNISSTAMEQFQNILLTYDQRLAFQMDEYTIKQRLKSLNA